MTLTKHQQILPCLLARVRQTDPGKRLTLRPLPSSISLPALYHYDDAKGAEKIDVATKDDERAATALVPKRLLPRSVAKPELVAQSQWDHVALLAIFFFLLPPPPFPRPIYIEEILSAWEEREGKVVLPLLLMFGPTAPLLHLSSIAESL